MKVSSPYMAPGIFLTVEERVAVDEAFRIISTIHGISREDILSKSHERRVVSARASVAALILGVWNPDRKRDLLPHISLQKLGMVFGGQHHSTIHNLFNKIHHSYMISGGGPYRARYEEAVEVFRLRAMGTGSEERIVARMNAINSMILQLVEEHNELHKRLETIKSITTKTEQP